MSNQEKERQTHEEIVATAFCARISKKYRIPCQFVKLNDPPAPDALISCDGEEVFLELAKYREIGPHNELDAKNEKLLDAVYEALRDDHECTLCFSFRESLAPAASIRDKKIIFPPQNKWSAFVNEAKSFCGAVPSPAGRSHQRVAFAPADKIVNRSRRDKGRHYIDESTYPTLSKFCNSITIHFHPGLSMERPTSSVDVRNTGLDSNEIVKTMSGKLGKLPGYREAADGRPVWLLYYSDGYSTSQVVGPPANQKLIQHMRSVLQVPLIEGKDVFDAIWWVNKIHDESQPSIHQIHPQRQFRQLIRPQGRVPARRAGSQC